MAIRESLRPYQVEALEKLVRIRKGLNFDDMRLGKTITTLAAVEELKAYPVLIVCPKFALYVWKEEIEKWLGETAYIYTGTPKKRQQQWQGFIASGSRFLITNFALLKDFTVAPGAKAAPPTPGTPAATKWRWGAFIADEIHMGGLLNQKTQTFKLVNKLTKEIPVIYLLTGTPMRQGCVDLYAPLHLVDRERFSSYWGFVNQHCVVIETPFGKEIERNPRDIYGFRRMLNSYMVRRIKSEVFKDLPTKQRQIIPVEMNSEQSKVYKELSKDLIATCPESGNIILTQSQLTLLIRQRQLLVCPQELGLKHRGGALDTLAEMSHTYLDDGKHIIVYTPFRKAVPYIEKMLHDEYDDVSIYKIQGQMSAEDFRASWSGFQNDKKVRKVLICVIKSCAAFKASAASAGFFLGCEWDFNLNEQAEDRMFDTADTEAIQVYYLMHKDTIEDLVKSRLNDKKKSSNWTVGTQEQFKYLLAISKKRR